jgi:large subunit ribosomal protein L15
MPLHRRLPKRGFHNIFRKRFAIINVGQIAKLKEKSISPELLLERGIVRDLGDGLKVLGAGELKKPVSVSAHQFSESAREKILQAGGKVEVLSGQAVCAAEQ